MISVVVPLYNEALTLKETVAEIDRQTGAATAEYEIILVDDGSTDGTWDAITQLGRESEKVRGVKLSRNFGKESAISAGLEIAGGDAVITMDGDLQHPPSLIPEMVALWRRGEAEIVEAVKTSRGKESLSSKLGARLFYWFMKHFAGLEIRDSSDFKLLDRKVVEAHNSLPEYSRFFRGIVSWLGFRKVSVPFSVPPGSRDASRWSLPALARLAVHATTAFSALPLHLITLLGFITLITSVVLTTQTLYLKFSGGAVSGFATVILLLLFIGSVLMISLGIIGIYISRIYEEVKRRPRFVTEETLNVSDCGQSRPSDRVGGDRDDAVARRNAGSTGSRRGPAG